MAERSVERPGSLVESHKGYDPRVVFFYFVVLALLLILVGGLAYQQLVKRDYYSVREEYQNQRRIVVPGPRGNIYDREHRLLVGNRPRFAVTIKLDELRYEIRQESIVIRNNYRELNDKDVPDRAQLEKIARSSVVQRKLDQINRALGRDDKIDGKKLENFYKTDLLLPFTLVSDLKPEEYAELIEQLPVQSPLQLFASSTRYYPYGSAAAHTLGYVRSADEGETDDSQDEDPDNPSGQEVKKQKIRTLSVKGIAGAAGLERQFDSQLQGQAGEATYRVSPAGFRIEPALSHRTSVQGKDLVSSIDIDLQMTAEEALGDMIGSAVAIDVHSGEVLALASKPDYNLNDFSPSLSSATVTDITDRGAWLNRATQGVYPPGSTFKILVSIAGMRSGALNPEEDTADCEGTMRIGGRTFACDNGEARHGVIGFREAIAHSCDIFFWTYGQKITHEVIVAEAQRFHLDRPTGIELPHESQRMLIPTTEWKWKKFRERWFPGDTANISIGQGDVSLTPLEMACFAASVARGETTTKPTLVHNPNPQLQRSEPIGLTPEQRQALLDGMEGVVTHGTASNLSKPVNKIPGLRIAGKTGTAEVGKKNDIAWFICFAPLENPEIAVAVCIEGDTPGDTFGGGAYAAPVANAVLQRWWNKKNHLPPPKSSAPKPAAPATPTE